MKKILQFSLGVTIGLTISIIISLIFAQGKFMVTSPNAILYSNLLKSTNETIANTVIFISWGMIGIISDCLSKVFKQDYSILKASLLHFSGMYITLLAIGFLIAGWFASLNGFIMFTLIFVIIYLIIYIFQYQTTKKEIEQINKIKKMQD